MSAGGASELRARLQGLGLRRAGETLRAAPGLALECEALDAVLGGGLGFGAHELAPVEPGDGAAAFGFALCLLSRALAWRGARAEGLIVQAAAPAGEGGELYGPGLKALGLDPDRLAVSTLRTAAEALRVADEALRSGAVAGVVLEAGATKAMDLALTRRFNLSAEQTESLVFLVVEDLDATSAALTRWRVGPGASDRSLGRRARLAPPRLAPPRFDLALMRNRRGPLGAWRVEWSHAARSFQTLDLVQPAAAAPVPAPVAAPADRRRRAAG
jgi:protein ImuA